MTRRVDMPSSNARARPFWRRPWFVTTLVFVVCVATIPRILAVVMANHYDASEQANMHVAVARGSGFELVRTRLPATMLPAVIVGDLAQPSAPAATEALDRVRVVRRDTAGTLIETVWSSNDYVITSRYLVRGQAVTPVWQKIFGIGHAMLGLLLSVVIALAYRGLAGRRQSAAG